MPCRGCYGCSVRAIDLQLPAGIVGNCDPWAVLRGCEGPRPDAKLPVIRLHPLTFLRQLHGTARKNGRPTHWEARAAEFMKRSRG
jgi:hypothetical protein